MASPREDLEGFLTPLLPDNWKIITSERSLDTPSTPTLRLRQTVIKHHASAPLGLHTIEFVAVLSSPLADVDRAEDELDDSVNTFMHALDDHPSVLWDEARKTITTESQMGYEITLTLTSRKDE
jgi:hypothetical protein